MAEVTSAMVKELREKTGAGMMDCKKALLEAGGDMEKAVLWLREKGLATAGKKAGRSATEGAVGSYIHLGGKIGVLVEINCETDFTARNEKFLALGKDVAMQIAWSNPRWRRRQEIARRRSGRSGALRARAPGPFALQARACSPAWTACTGDLGARIHRALHGAARRGRHQGLQVLGGESRRDVDGDVDLLLSREPDGQLHGVPPGRSTAIRVPAACGRRSSPATRQSCAR